MKFGIVCFFLSREGDVTFRLRIHWMRGSIEKMMISILPRNHISITLPLGDQWYCVLFCMLFAFLFIVILDAFSCLFSKLFDFLAFFSLILSFFCLSFFFFLLSAFLYLLLYLTTKCFIPFDLVKLCRCNASSCNLKANCNKVTNNWIKSHKCE